jgi:hypothetical protein
MATERIRCILLSSSLWQTSCRFKNQIEHDSINRSTLTYLIF